MTHSVTEGGKMDIGKECTETEACTLPNLFCQHPSCTFGKAQKKATAADNGKLLACPFCGSPAELEHGSDHHGTWFNLGCSRHWGKNPDDACPGGRIWYTEPPENETDAIKKWNARATKQQG